ncbi:NAD(P)/FAD-dependent oxidoreductase [Sphingomonas sp. DT-207]|uniref:NAD(P)/FAD-dependent oxidoreductase n=1 Tax=Sphingomonas sp. DT-207 TaxID=3396167 RepID=UPI003F1DE7D6
MTFLVIGGGIVGRSIALALARRGQRVTIVDAASGNEAASWGNAGHIATEQVAPLASPATIRSLPRRLFRFGGAVDLPPGMARDWLPFAARLLAASTPVKFAQGSAALGALLAEAMPAWSRLAEVLGRPDLLRADGHFVTWESAAGAKACRAAWQAADTGTARIGDVDAATLAQLRTLSPGIVDAIRFAGSGQIADLDMLAEATRAALADAGVAMLLESVRIECDGSRLHVPGFPAERIIVAAGASSRALMAPAGHRVPLIAERGYHVRASAERWPADLPPVVFEDRSIIATRFADSVQIAGFVEFGALDAPPDPRKWQRLEAHAAALGLPVTGPFRRWMGARPTLPDYLPAIGRSTRAANLFYAFGHQHLGLTLAPVTAEAVAALACGDTPAIDLAPFDLARFG